MTDVTIHSIRLSYDETDERVRSFVNFLKNRKEEFISYHNLAKSIFPEEKYIVRGGDEFSLVCDRNHKCILKLRGM